VSLLIRGAINKMIYIHIVATEITTGRLQTCLFCKMFKFTMESSL